MVAKCKIALQLKTCHSCCSGESKAFINGTRILERITEFTYGNGTTGQRSSLGKIDIETILVGDSLEEAQAIFNTVRTSSWAREVPKGHTACH